MFELFLCFMPWHPCTGMSLLLCICSIVLVQSLSVDRVTITNEHFTPHGMVLTLFVCCSTLFKEKEMFEIVASDCSVCVHCSILYSVLYFPSLEYSLEGNRISSITPFLFLSLYLLTVPDEVLFYYYFCKYDLPMSSNLTPSSFNFVVLC